MSEVFVGKCSLCGGKVCVPTVYFGQPPTPTCRSCGAVKQNNRVIQMEKPATANDALEKIYSAASKNKS